MLSRLTFGVRSSKTSRTIVQNASVDTTERGEIDHVRLFQFVSIGSRFGPTNPRAGRSGGPAARASFLDYGGRDPPKLTAGSASSCGNCSRSINRRRSGDCETSLETAPPGDLRLPKRGIHGTDICETEPPNQLRVVFVPKFCVRSASLECRVMSHPRAVPTHSIANYSNLFLISIVSLDS